jgi:hypothetical protein
VTTAASRDHESGLKYWAFLSYSHRDEAWARWLHHALETYRIPRRLAQRSAASNSELLSERIYPVFRDRDELSGGFDLSAHIKAALEQSRFLIVICSPHAVASRHVQEEIDVFEGFGREHRVIVAEMLGVPFDELKQRDKNRRFRRRIRMAAAVAGSSIVVGMTYLLALDAGVKAPGEATVRRLADRYGLSAVRRLPSEIGVQQKAQVLRKRLTDQLLTARRGDWFLTSFRPEESSGEDVWIHSQIAFALLSLPDGEATAHDIASLLAKPFTSNLKFERRGVRYGWLAGLDDVSPISPPAFWTAMSHAVALGKHAYQPGQTEEALQRVAYVQDALGRYQPDGTAGWNLFPNQRMPTEHNVYAATLALMALLETKRADLPWQGSVHVRDRLIRQTFDWLVDKFEPGEDPPGWKAGGASLNTTSEGLSLQIYGRLLDARSEAGLTIPPAILREIPRHVASMAERTLDFPSSSGEFSSIIAFEGEKPQRVRESINFPWYSWAPDLAIRWLRSQEGRAAPVEERVAVERALAHLVMTLGDEAVKTASEGWTFVAAETLYGLTAVVPLDRR